jgi:hypothetical protein
MATMVVAMVATGQHGDKEEEKEEENGGMGL